MGNRPASVAQAALPKALIGIKTAATTPGDGGVHKDAAASAAAASAAAAEAVFEAFFSKQMELLQVRNVVVMRIIFVHIHL